jgi:preprotein translocase subunit SecG
LLYTIIVIAHVILCVCLVAIVLFQVGKGASMSGFLRGSSTEMFLGSAGGSTVIKKVTAIFAILFMVTSLSLTIMSAKRPRRSLMDIMPPAPTIPKDDVANTQPVPTTPQQSNTGTEQNTSTTK